MDTKNGTIGGGEVLKYWNQNGKTDGTSYLDSELITQFLMLPIVRALIIVLLVVITIVLIMKVLQIRSPFKGRAITNELKHTNKVKKRDDAIIRANKSIKTLTKLVQNSPFALNKSYIDYWTYNLTRANVRIPGKFRIMTPEEFHAIISACKILVCLISIIIIIVVNAPIGVIIMTLSLVILSTIPKFILRHMVNTKDNEIVENFADFYLMIHYVLLASAGTPINGIMRSYAKTTSSYEMHRFIDVCVHNIDTYGEYEATRYIAKQYREVAEIGKLMRLIRQANEGGDVRAELLGFRSELLNAKKYAIGKRMDKLILKANMSFNILTPILVQAVISAAAIYIKDLNIASTIF